MHGRHFADPLGIATLAAFCLFAGAAAPAHAATVNLFAAPAGARPGACSSAADPCSIATAVTNANAAAVTDDVRIELASGDYNLLPGLLAGTALPITFAGPSLTLAAASGATPVLNGESTTRVLSVAAASNVSIERLTIASGLTTGLGGGILNNGKLIVRNSTFSSNRAGNGGAIASPAGSTLTVQDSTFSDNTSTSVGGGAMIVFGTATVERTAFLNNTAPINGGAINIQPNGTATVTSSTLAGNTSGGLGGALSNLGTLTVQASTIIDNTASDGAAIATGNTNVTFAASIIAAQASGGACNPLNAAIVDGGYNLDSDGTCISPTTPATGSHNGTTAYGSSTYAEVLAAYLADGPADNGGPTKTVALLNTPDPLTTEANPALAVVPASFTLPVAVGGVSAACSLPDQRGVVPVAGADCDIGAYLLQTTKTALTTPAAVAGKDVTFTATITPAASGGTVAFDDGAGNPATANCAAQPVSSGTATCTVSYPDAGEHQVTATYSGDGALNNFVGSTSPTQTVVVAPAPVVPVEPTPTPTPAPTTPPVTNPAQVVLCGGRSLVLLDLRRSGQFALVGGQALTSLAGTTVQITANRGGGSATAKVGADGSFTARLPRPTSRQTRYRASSGASNSDAIKLTRSLSVVSRKKVAAGLRIVARHSKGNRVKGQTANVLRRSGCGKQSGFARAKFNARGEVTVTLPFATAPDTIAVYRVTTRAGNTFTLPILVRR